jgi:alpha-1,3-rhamnosyltransferase
MNELVSVVVLTYQAALYIEETLDSIFRQEYSPLELVITDDASTDDTITVCKNWLEHHKHRFSNVRLLRVDKNTGTSRNANRGVRASSGSWIKILAGDDLLQPDAINSFVQFIQQKDIQVVVSSMIPFRDKENTRHFAKEKNYSREFLYKSTTTIRQQFLALLYVYCINSPTLFMKRSAFDEVDGYDEEMRIIEDMPLYFRLALHRKRIYYLNKATVQYRIHSSSVSQSVSGSRFSDLKKLDRERRYKYYIEPNTTPLARVLYNALMKVYYQPHPFAKWRRRILAGMGILFIKLRVIE